MDLRPAQALRLLHEFTYAVVTDGEPDLSARHLAPIDTAEPDFRRGRRALPRHALSGGKTSLGLDCSGLVQVALTACGIPSPRDSDMQEQALGTPVAADPATLVHANAFPMAVAIEPLKEAMARIRTAGSEVTSVRRL